MKALTRTELSLPGQVGVYHGKVRDVYNINDDLMVMVATDRISAFDVILPKGIPFKGQVLNQIAAKFLDETADIVPNWKIATPDPMVTVGLKADGFRVEMIIRGYLTGSAWREYRDGGRLLCGVPLPDGMRENQRSPVMGFQQRSYTLHKADDVGIKTLQPAALTHLYHVHRPYLTRFAAQLVKQGNDGLLVGDGAVKPSQVRGASHYV